MKVVILAGGLGTRLSEYTKTIPKPMVKVDKKPIIFHIMKHYARYGFKEFYLAGGYKHEVIKKFFKKKFYDWKVKIIDTGQKTMTGGRLKRLKKFLKDDTFMLTYGDGLSNINLKKLLKFHKENKKMVTMTAVRPPARFGSIKIKGNKVEYFKEKSRMDEGWINGGFFIMEPKFLNYIKSDLTYLEKYPLEKVTKMKELNAYKHYGYWQCIDTKRDLDRVKKFLLMKFKK
jgi:glucose-1-phosphate cytidylyltransferase